MGIDPALLPQERPDRLDGRRPVGLACDLVRVAGFEPAASSSRSQIAVRTARAAVRLIWERTSINIRQRLVMNVPIGPGLVHAWSAVK